MLTNQDWKEVIIRKPKENVSTPKGQVQSGVTNKTIGQRPQSATPSWKIEKMCDDGIALNRVGPELGKAIMKARLEKKMSQKELGMKVYENERVINEIERGVAVKNGPLLAKIRKVLGLSAVSGVGGPGDARP